MAASLVLLFDPESPKSDGAIFAEWYLVHRSAPWTGASVSARPLSGGRYLLSAGSLAHQAAKHGLGKARREIAVEVAPRVEMFGDAVVEFNE